MTSDDEAAYQELQAYTLTHGDAEFLHQYVVDAGTAQWATVETKPIALTFALMGLYLHVEHAWTGRQVQRGHMALARSKQTWPSLHLPDARGAISPRDVMAVKPGPDRDAAIQAWCADVWAAYADNRGVLRAWLAERGIQEGRHT
jgi:hypothetical protein